MIRFLHLADLHLGAAPLYLGDLAQERSKDYLNAFQRAVDYAIEPANSINAVLVVGDFFDVPNPSQEIIRFTTTQLKRLEQVKIPVIVTPGNHDAFGAPESIYKTSSIKGLLKIIESPQVEYYKPLVMNQATVYFGLINLFISLAINSFHHRDILTYPVNHLSEFMNIVLMEFTSRIPIYI